MLHVSPFSGAVAFEPIARTKTDAGTPLVVWLERPSDECGCPEREITIGTCLCLLHFEADGDAHIIADFGDWQDEIHTPATSMDHLQQIAIKHVEGLPIDG